MAKIVLNSSTKTQSWKEAQKMWDFGIHIYGLLDGIHVYKGIGRDIGKELRVFKHSELYRAIKFARRLAKKEKEDVLLKLHNIYACGRWH